MRTTKAKTSLLQRCLDHLRDDSLLIFILILAAFLRFWQLPELGIFFGDAAHDLRTAAEAVETRQVPLLGINSSIPRFRQGPVSVWISMAVYSVAGYQSASYFLVFAVIALLGLVAMYEWLLVTVDKRTALWASIWLGFSPLAMAHARMPYHTTPIPLFLVLFLASLSRVAQKQPRALFWSVLAWAVLFQFELALAPLLLLVPYVLWRQGQLRWARKWLLLKEGLLGLILGLVPQLIYDVTHQFSQLGGFAIWVAYRLGIFAGVTGEGFWQLDRLKQVGEAFWLYGGRLVGFDQPGLTILLLVSLVGSLVVMTRKWRQKQLPLAIEVSSVGFVLLTLSYIVHGAPGEAYFPPYLVLVPVLLAYGLSSLAAWYRPLIWVGLSCWAAFAVWGVFRAHYFVSTSQAFNYGPSVAEQRQIISLIKERTTGDFYLRTTREEGTFASFFDSLRWLAQEQGIKETPGTGELFWVEAKDSPLQNYPEMVKYELPTVDVYQVRSN